MRSEGLFKALWTERPKSSATPDSSPPDAIVIRGARVHNLRDVNARIPRDRLVVLTGPSGSGKSSLAFDTIYAEGQRRYVESLSAFARQFLEQMTKPDVDSIEGLSPTISIDQKTSGRNPRSTVGTVTEIYDYLRVLYAKVAKPFCYECGKPIRSQSPQQIVDAILSLPDGTKAAILAPLVRGRKGEYQKELEKLREKGFVRVRVNGQTRDLSEEIRLDRQKKHSIEVYVDRLLLKNDRPELLARVSESVELALQLGSGALLLETPSGEQLFSQNFACPDCGVSYPTPEPALFSFNSPKGSCEGCDGLGFLSREEEEEEREEEPAGDTVVPEEGPEPCPDCSGRRLRKEALHFRLGEYNISDLCGLTLGDSRRVLRAHPLTDREKTIVGRLLKEVDERLGFLEDVGASYLSLARPARSLSGGETQRIRLATQIGSALVGVIYVLDEPSIGLHARDTERLLGTLRKLRDAGNTVLVVEHDEETMEAADWILDIGPGAGERGGRIVAEGSPKDLKRNDASVTGKYLSGKLAIPVPAARRKRDAKRTLRVTGARKNNLKNVDLEIPLGLLTCITGVSGSGKSTLVLDTLYPLLFEHVYRNTGARGISSLLARVQAEKIEGLDLLDKVVEIDQSPIGRTPRSNPATYTGTFTFIRQLFAGLVEAQLRGLGPGRFSFNVTGGRCEACEGAGIRRIEMHFLPDVFVTCETCKGSRYQRETLEIRYKGKSIADVLAMSVEDALAFFDAVPYVRSKLQVLNDVGLGYLRLGQSATTLSGGEAQRIKLSRELSKRGTGRTLYILDEPSTGLHFDDIAKLLRILHALVDQGNTVVVIEHNLDIVKSADHVVDLGPEGGAKGGEIVASGTPEAVAKSAKSVTGKYLGRLLRPGP